MCQLVFSCNLIFNNCPTCFNGLEFGMIRAACVISRVRAQQPVHQEA